MHTKNRVFAVMFIALFSVFICANGYSATLTGKSQFKGAAPVAEKLKINADPKCAIMHPDGLTPDDVVVNANGTLKDVFVYVKEGVTGTYPAPKDAVKLDQHGCQYSPKVFGIQVGQPLEIINSDDTLHNVHSLANNSKQFNLGMPIKGMKLKKSFEKPETMVKIKCEVHPWMATYAGVLEHPFYGVTDDQGAFEIKNLPPGTYVIEAWHSKYGSKTQSITIADDGQSQDVSFEFGA